MGGTLSLSACLSLTQSSGGPRSCRGTERGGKVGEGSVPGMTMILLTKTAVMYRVSELQKVKVEGPPPDNTDPGQFPKDVTSNKKGLSEETVFQSTCVKVLGQGTCMCAGETEKGVALLKQEIEAWEEIARCLSGRNSCPQGKEGRFLPWPGSPV